MPIKGRAAMKWLFRVVFLVLTSITPLLGQAPHLILHFDVNKTLIASDKAGDKSIEDVLNQLLSARYKYCWDSNVEEQISYDAYVRDILLPGSENDAALKTARRAYLDHFVDYLRKQSHPLYPAVIENYNTALRILQSCNGCVFPSFYQLLEDFDRKNVSYTIVLRSFGEDVFNVAKEINTTYKETFFQYGVFEKGVLSIGSGETDKTPRAIYEALGLSGHIAIRDDWGYWMQGGMKSEFGKPFYLDQEDRNTLSLFFDDNIHLDGREKNIIAPMSAKTGKMVAFAELSSTRQVVCVDTLEAILNNYYFIELIQEAVANRETRESGLVSQSS